MNRPSPWIVATARVGLPMAPARGDDTVRVFATVDGKPLASFVPAPIASPAAPTTGRV